MANKILGIQKSKATGNYVIVKAGAPKELRKTLTKSQKEWLAGAEAGSGMNSNYIYYRKK